MVNIFLKVFGHHFVIMREPVLCLRISPLLNGVLYLDLTVLVLRSDLGACDRTETNRYLVRQNFSSYQEKKPTNLLRRDRRLEVTPSPVLGFFNQTLRTL